MTLIRGANVAARGGLSSLGPNTTIYGEESLVENGEIEELHYLSVKVERMKKAMLNRVEGMQISQSELKVDGKSSALAGQKTGSGLILDENDRKEEMLYRSMDNIIDQTGGGDIINAKNSMEVGNSKMNVSEDVLRRNSELNQYSEIAISD